MKKIPFNRPAIVGNEMKYISRALSTAVAHVSGDGVYTRRCEKKLKSELGCRRAFLTTSCTDALEMAALLLNLKPGDEVIVPSFTFVSTANAFALRGARPVFADIRPDTLNIDEEGIERLITKRTKAVVPVHYAGVGCEMDRICQIARKTGIAVVEDNAHGLFAEYRGRKLGTIGDFGTLSFHETKNFICGEGGALLVNNPSFLKRAEIVRDKGTDRARFLRGEVDKYTWVDFGSSFLPSDILAAFLCAQLEKKRMIQGRRKAIWERYMAGLEGWASSAGARLPAVPPHCSQSWHMFYMLMRTPGERRDLIAHLRKRNIHAIFHYVPLHSSKMGKAFGGRKGSCPVAEHASVRLLRLPFYLGISEHEQDRVVAEIRKFRM